MSGGTYSSETYGKIFGHVVGENNTVTINLPDGTSRTISVDAAFFVQLASEPQHFVGRKKELEELKAAILSDKPQTIAILGMGGIGKTTLASKLVSDLVPVSFPGGVLWADFPSTRGDEMPILTSWAQLCGRPELASIPSEDIRARAVAGAISDHIKKFGRMLAVFDDVRDTREDPWISGSHSLQKAIPRGTPIIITTRQVSIAMSFNALPTITLEPLKMEEALDLITKLVPEIDLLLANEVLEIIGNLPLAIEITSSLIREDGIEWVINSLRNSRKRTRLLNISDNADKDYSIALSFDLSYKSLSSESSKIFRALGVFSPGYFEKDWVSGLFSYYNDLSLSGETETIEYALRDLSKRSLLQRTEKGYRLHPLLRDYAFEMLATDREMLDAITQAHESFFLELALSKRDEDQVISLAVRNIIQAISFAHQNKKYKDILEFVQPFATTGGYLHRQGLWKEAIGILEYGLEACLVEKDDILYATLLCELGMYQREMGDYPSAEITFRRAAEISKQLNNKYTLATSLSGLGHLLVYARRSDEARAIIAEAMQFANESNNRVALGQATLSAARMKIASGLIPEARDLANQSVRILGEVNDHRLLSYSLRVLGETHMVDGSYDLAIKYYDQALDEARKAGDLQAQAYTYRGIGDAHKQANQYKLAIDAYNESEQLYRKVGDKSALSGTLCSLGETYLILNDIERAHGCFEEGLTLAGENRWLARNTFGIAQIEHKRGNNEKAVGLAREALSKLNQIPHRDAVIIERWLLEVQLNPNGP